MCLEELLDVVLAERTVDAVAALDDHVPRPQLEGEDVDRDDELSSETAWEGVTARLVAHLLHGRGAGGGRPNPRMALGRLGEGPVSGGPDAAGTPSSHHDTP